MLQNLYIKNYALIDKINLSFNKGLTIITGETGAGKSILLGGLDLVRGKRAQQGLLRDALQKSIVEATFDIAPYHLQIFLNRRIWIMNRKRLSGENFCLTVNHVLLSMTHRHVWIV